MQIQVYVLQEFIIIRICRQIKWKQMGAEDSKPEPSAQKQVKKPEDVRVERQVKAEKIAVNLDNNVNSFRDQEAKLEAKIEFYKEKAKELIANDKQKEAKKILEEATKLKKKLTAIETRRKILAGKKDELEIHQMNADVIDVLEEANAFTTEDLTGKLQEHIITAKENKIIADQIENQMRGLVENDQDDQAVDDMLKELEQDVLKKKKEQIAGKNPAVGVQVQKQKMKQSEKDEIEAMLNGL